MSDDQSISRDANEGRRSSERRIREQGALTDKEVEQVRDRIKMRARAVYTIVKEEGDAELARPSVSLTWSGLIAGIAMGFSVLAMAVLKKSLPDEPWSDLVASLGYGAGFLIVILGRMQLFTENTITAVLPLTSEFSSHNLYCFFRLWSIVLMANLAGCAIIAFGFTHLNLLPDDIAASVVEVSRHLLDIPVSDAFAHGIGAGFLVAALVWMMPSAETSEFVVIALTAWLISAAGFTHVIAGSVESAVLVFEGEIGAWNALITVTLPVLAGNIVGGTALFAFLSYGQVKNELESG